MRDVSGSWLIEIIFGAPYIYVVHTKRAKCCEEESDDNWSFLWHFIICFDKDLTQPVETQLVLSSLDAPTESIKENIRRQLKQIQTIDYFT
jgi:hypothetical protein